MKNTLYRILTIACMAALVFVSVQPASKGHGSDIPRQIFNNMLHIPAYGLLTLLLIKSVICHCEATKRPKQSNIIVYIASFLFALAFGIFNEYLQSFVPGRYVSAMDVALNAIGSLSVVAVIANEAKLRTVIARRREAPTKQSKRAP